MKCENYYYNCSGWSYDTVPTKCPVLPPNDILINNPKNLTEIRKNRIHNLCRTSLTLGAKWAADFGKSFNGKKVQLEVQFGTVECMFKDFCGFKIAKYERRLDLGIEIILCKPNEYFSHRKSAISGMAYLLALKNDFTNKILADKCQLGGEE